MASKMLQRTTRLGGVKFYSWSGKLFRLYASVDVFMFALTLDRVGDEYHLSLWVKTTHQYTYRKVADKCFKQRLQPTSSDISHAIAKWQSEREKNALMLGLPQYNNCFDILREKVLLSPNP